MSYLAEGAGRLVDGALKLMIALAVVGLLSMVGCSVAVGLLIHEKRAAEAEQVKP